MGTHTGSVGNLSGMSVQSLGREMLESHTLSRQIPMPTVELCGQNMLRLTRAPTIHLEYIVDARIGYTDDMFNLHSSSIRPFAMMCLEKAKMLIWNKLIVQIDRGYVEGGFDIGVVKDIVDKYEDAWERYEEQLLQYRGSHFLSTANKQLLFKYML